MSPHFTCAKLISLNILKQLLIENVQCFNKSHIICLKNVGCTSLYCALIVIMFHEKWTIVSFLFVKGQRPHLLCQWLTRLPRISAAILTRTRALKPLRSRRTVLVQIGNHLVDRRVLRFESQRLHRNLCRRTGLITTREEFLGVSTIIWQMF